MDGSQEIAGSAATEGVTIAPKSSRWRHLAIGLLVMFMTCVIMALLLEAAAIALNYQKHGRLRGSCLTHELRLGWDLAGDCRLKTKTLADADGEFYQVNYATNVVGSRHWGDVSSPKRKVMIIGDSFTDAQEVSNDKTYYRVLGDLADVEIFAYGVGGYGTLQQWLKTKELLRLVQPDIYILQFCSNDFHNNSITSETMSVVESQKTRPYWQDGAILYHHAPNGLYHRLISTSLAFRFVDGRLQRLRYAANGNDYYSAEQRQILVERRPEDLAITGDLLKRLAADLPKATDLYAFNCQPETGTEQNVRDSADFKTVAEAAGFQVIDGIAAHAREKGEQQGRTVFAADTAHLNERGHNFWGAYLADFLKDRYPN